MTRASSVTLLVVATEAERPPEFAGEVLVCGVGKTGAAAATAARLARGGVGAAISFGVAGAYPGAGLAVGDVVVATEVAVLDEGLESGERFAAFAHPSMTVPGAAWTPCAATVAESAPGAAFAAPCFDDREQRGPRSPRDAERRTAFRVVRGRIATVSVCAGSERLARERRATGAVAESMEGAAVAFAASLFGVPFAEIRGISNLCGPREGARFDLAGAVKNAASVLGRA